MRNIYFDFAVEMKYWFRVVIDITAIIIQQTDWLHTKDQHPMNLTKIYH